ncbi:MAG: hypothetical protein WED10_00055 [Brumimicrobium sp.]
MEKVIKYNLFTPYYRENTFIYVIIISCFFLGSCQEPDKSPEKLKSVADKGDLQKKREIEFIKGKESKYNKRKIYKEVGYEVKPISAIDFLERKGESIAPDDIEQLKKESVFILDISSLSTSKRTPFSLEQCTLDKETAIEHFAFNLEKEVQVKQGAKIFQPTGSHFERDFGVSDRLRVVFFFKDLSLNKSFEFIYIDRLFGAQELNFIFEQNKPV